jgi:hypothetical protein
LGRLFLLLDDLAFVVLVPIAEDANFVGLVLVEVEPVCFTVF